MKRKIVTFSVLFFVLVLMTACGKTAAEKAGATVDYGESQLYTREEMDKAIDLIFDEFNKWDGCKMGDIRYAGDDCNTPENIAWMSSLKDGKKYTQCIEFYTDFHSPVEEEDLLGTAWEPDEDYANYEWWLARKGDGGWDLVNWGY